MEDLGTRIQELRKNSKLSQTDLADKIGISKSLMIRYENKGVQPPADILSKLANIFSTSFDFLMNLIADNLANNTLSDKELIKNY
jgi:transcriptional regulator with XRE-family HTH domain